MSDFRKVFYYGSRG